MVAPEQVQVLTIGHSAQSFADFLGLLRQADVTAIADVRSIPYSRRVPHFNPETLREKLGQENIAYVFLGDELGGRPRSQEFLTDGAADYERMAESESFARGLDRVIEGARDYRIALMCAERDPLDCHRCLLVGRALKERGAKVRHILSNGETTGQDEIEEQLLAMADLVDQDLFQPREARLAAAYRSKARRASYSASEAAPGNG